MGQHTGDKWLIHSTKHHRYNQLQSLNSSVEYPSWKYQFNIKESDSKKSNLVLKLHNIY